MLQTDILREEVKHFISLADPKTVKLVHAMLEADLGQNDWWDELPPAAKQSIDRALAQSDAGKGIPHEEVLKRYSQWFTK